ncbi:MAG: hypothetical protein ACFCAD_19080 [Pleurocapsa sp.]
MNTSLHLPDDVAKRLDAYISQNKEKISRNKIIVRAIEEMLERNKPKSHWSDEVLNWKGEPGLELDRESQDWGDFSF